MLSEEDKKKKKSTIRIKAELVQNNKLSSSIQCQGQYLTRISPDRGEISFLKEFPIWAAAKGNFPWLNSKSRLKFKKIPCAVSGLKYL
jgi:hypothetical protein